MAKSIVKRIQPFDATENYTVDVFWSGTRSYALRIIISNAKSNEVVWDNKQTTYSLSRTIPANTLKNGVRYFIQSQTFDIDGNPSTLSDKVLFYCFATPTFSFANVPETVPDSSYNATVKYYSSDWEDISTYTFYLYDANKVLLLTSDPQYDQDDLSYTYRGLENRTTYYIRCVGVTVNGMQVDTGYYPISIVFKDASAYARIYAQPLNDQGCVKVSTNLIIIQQGDMSKQYSFSDGRIDLTDDNLFYNEGFLIEDDFTILLQGLGLWKNDTIMRLKNSDGYEITLTSHIYSDDQLRFRLTAPNGLSNYIIYSEPVVFEDTDEVTVAVRRIDNIYQIKVFLDFNPSTEGDYWWGTLRPNGAQDYDIWIDTESSTTTKITRSEMKETLTNEEPVGGMTGDLWYGE